MSRLLLLRHAKAAWAKPGTKDFNRPLDVQGLASLDGLAHAMQFAGIIPDRVVFSGARRTRETAFGLIGKLGLSVEAIADDALYNAGPGKYMQSVRQNGDVETLMLVGHNPSIEDLALALCSDGEKSAIQRLHSGFPTAALATISFGKLLPEIDREDGFLESFPSPIGKA
ncbi:histidine phosphatase family protein [Ochrobactrum sp. CM-21-5]|nr:histidine phosphatase family protein [Ochrobactrum sp. CM-21-5]MBC2886662.1 histidine phosphatase family protein [Ochrobactrum sp. CM-21-5]